VVADAVAVMVSVGGAIVPLTVAVVAVCAPPSVTLMA
jgi:hypothetical protein